jgi:hypothetical protein
MIDTAGMKCLGNGRNRIVYLTLSGKNVIKVPLNEDGISDNFLEDFRYRRCRAKWYPLARCRLLDYTQYILIMEYVEPAIDSFSLASWVYSVDCG